MERDLEGRTALVTGSGRNIGRAIALELAAKGADIVVNARSSLDAAMRVADEVRALGVRCVVAMGDVSLPADVEEICQVVRNGLGDVDILVSNAAVRPYQSFLELPVEDWERILSTQLTASFRLAKAFVPGMKERHWGRIIHITGPDAFIGLTHRSHNVAAKGGLRGLTKALAVELGPFGITVNDVAPGTIATIRDAGSHPAVTSGAPVPNFDEIVTRIPVGRLGQPEDVAYACGALASPRASFITGTVISCFGGQWNPG